VSERTTYYDNHIETDGKRRCIYSYLVAKELGFKYLDREILRQAAERLGTDVRMLERP